MRTHNGPGGVEETASTASTKQPRDRRDRQIFEGGKKSWTMLNVLRREQVHGSCEVGRAQQSIDNAASARTRRLG